MLMSMCCRCVFQATLPTRIPRLCLAKPVRMAFCNQSQFSKQLRRSWRNEHKIKIQLQEAGSQGTMCCVKKQRSMSVGSYTSLASQETNQAKADKKRSELALRNRICSMRIWEHTKLGQQLRSKRLGPPSASMKFTLLSYNVLAQYLLEEHMYLYKNVNQDALLWDQRANRIVREIKDCKADILCFQEVQANHYDSFFVPVLGKLGFQGTYKKRTGDKLDGCAIFYRKSKFRLKASVPVEYYRPGTQRLDRDNIGLIALLAPNDPKSETPIEDQPFICVATTHLLYNPKRHDIKLAQLQLLFAEIDHLAYKDVNEREAKYHPVILTGDFNLSPNTSVYQFITSGSLQYQGLTRGELTPASTLRGQVIDKELIPQHLNVTNQCQHLHSVEKRLTSLLAGTGNSDACTSHLATRFASGRLSHQLQLRSAYPHYLDRLNGVEEATTHQNSWSTVDYIFYNGSDQTNDTLQLVSRLGLLSGKEIDFLGGLPSLASPSDHLPLAAVFLWNYENRSQLPHLNSRAHGNPR